MDGHVVDHGNAVGQDKSVSGDQHLVVVAGGFRYGDALIQERGEMISLTDMWKAAGAASSRQPAEWLRSADAERFCEHLAASLNLGISQVWFSKAGRHGGGSWGHWQVAMAYAKYLSPEFHIACNTIVRAHMEGHVAPTAVTIAEPILPPVPSKQIRDAYSTFDMIARLSGLTGNQRALAAARGTRAQTGIDPLAMMGITHLIAEDQDKHLTPTDIGLEIDMKARQVNQLLKEKGLQTDRRDKDNNLCWDLTPAGAQYGVVLDTGKKHGDGTPVRQLKWRTSVVAVLKGEMH